MCCFPMADGYTTTTSKMTIIPMEIIFPLVLLLLFIIELLLLQL